MTAAVIILWLVTGCGSGSSGDGGSPTMPPPPGASVIRVPEDFATIGAAVAAANAGDTIRVGRGTYSETGTLNISIDLSIESAFVDTGDQGDITNTVISGAGGNDLFIIGGGASFRIEGLTIENCGKPITIDVGHGIIRSNVVRNNSNDAISFEGDSSGVAEFNTITNSGDDAIDIDGSRGPYTIRGNRVSGTDDDGMEFRMLDAYLVGGTIRYEVYENIIQNTAGDGIQLIDYPTDSEDRREINIHHNLIENATFAGIGTMPDQMSQRADLGETYPDIGFAERVFVTNNTIVDSDNGIAGGDNFIVLNNIVANNRLGVTNVDADSRLDYTMFFNNALSGVPPEVQGANIVFDDPLLDNEGLLQNGSPAIDAGASTYSWQGQDVLSIAVFDGSAPDLGWAEKEPT